MNFRSTNPKSDFCAVVRLPALIEITDSAARVAFRGSTSGRIDGNADVGGRAEGSGRQEAALFRHFAAH